MMIKCLPKEVQGKLRSGVAVPSLQQCVEELILNSIDAGATCVGVRMDMEAMKVQVIDNGAGMSAEDMESVGNRYYTSKCSAVEDLDNLKWYGFRGEALASIVSLAALVEISSRTRSTVKTYVKIFKDGKGLDVSEAEIARPSAGSTIVICNFFHNMPVRRKRMDAVLEGERIRHRVEAISLMHPSVSFTLKNDCTGVMTVQLPKARNTYYRFVQIHTIGRAQKLGEINHTNGQFEVIGYIGREGHYNNSLQFLYINERLLLKTRVHKLLNFLLRRLSSSNQKNDSPQGQAAIRSPKHKRSQELHGVYVINIKCSYSEYDICLEPAKTLIEFRDWDAILLCVQEAVTTFINRENLVAVLSQDELDYLSPKMFHTDNTDQEGAIADQATSGTSTLDCNIGIKMASHSVHRKFEDNSSVCQKHDEKIEQLEPKNITVHLETLESADSVNKECRDEPHSDLVRVEHESNIITNEEEPTLSETGEGSYSLCLSKTVGQLESKELEPSTEIKTQLNSSVRSNCVTSVDIMQQFLNSNEQIQLGCEGTGGYAQTFICNRKVSLSDPFRYENMETWDTSQSSRSMCQQKRVLQKCVERTLAPKRKISLEADNEGPFQKLYKDFASIVPSKKPTVSSCQKVSLCNKSGSLDKFRRVFSKMDDKKLFSLESNLRNPGLLQTGSPHLNAQNLLAWPKDQRDGDVKDAQEEEKTHSTHQSPPSHSPFTGLKQVSGQFKKSLAAKLFHMKQHQTDASENLPHWSRTTSQGNICHSNGKDTQRPYDTVMNPECVSSCSKIHELADMEEDKTSADWLHHYDTSVGKMGYVNKLTGLSRYEDPEETQVPCISDVTNMAVSVVNEMGELVDISHQ